MTALDTEQDLYGPFRLGDSPFRVKGSVYLGLHESFERRVPGGMSAVLARIDRPAVGAFFAQPFLVGSTYDILPLMEVSQTAARIVHSPWRDFVRTGSKLQAERDLNGVYRMLLRLASPRLVVERLPRILSQYMSFARVEGWFTGETSYEARAYGIPRPVSLWMLAMAEGFIPTLMTAAGAKDVALHVHPSAPEGKMQGMDLFTSHFRITWA